MPSHEVVAPSRPWWGKLIEPVVALDVVAARKARLLAALLLSLIVLGATSAVIQATTVPNFRPTLMAMGTALLVLTVAYAGSRTRLYRLSAALAAVAPALACIAIGIRSPDDRVWYAFILIAVVVSSLFFSIRTATVVAAALFATLCLLPIWVLEFRSPARVLPLLALHGVLSPLLLIAAHHHAAIERETQRELQRRATRLVELERLEAFARSTAHASHDINNLLTIIDANLAYLSEHPEQGRSDVIAESRSAVTRLAALSRSLSASARVSVEQPREFDPSEAIREFAPLLAQLAGPSVKLVVGSVGLGDRIRMDPLRFEQLLMNLVANARDAMPEGGRIDVECSRVTLNETHAEAPDGNQPTHFIVIDVTDTGSGMSEAILARIFEPFFTTKPTGRGTGLGLAIVSQIVAQHGGHVRVSSTPGHGSRFRTFFPTR